MAHAHYFGLFVAMRPASTLDACAHRDGYGDIAYAPNPAKKVLIASASILTTSYLADSDNLKELLLFSFC